MITFNISTINLEKIGKVLQQIFDADLTKEEAIVVISILKEANNYSRERFAVLSALTDMGSKAQNEKKTKADDYSIA